VRIQGEDIQAAVPRAMAAAGQQEETASPARR